MIKLKLACVAIFAMLGHLAFSQSTVSGVVSDETGAPLPGASVVVSGTTNGTQTDFDGNYILSDVPSDATLSFSYIGYVTQQLPVNGRTTINISMSEDLQALDEVVVVGYGTQSRAEVTGPSQLLVRKKSPHYRLQVPIRHYKVVQRGLPF